MQPIQGEHIAIMPFTQYSKTSESAAIYAARHAVQWQTEHADQFVLCMVTESKCATPSGFWHTYTLIGYTPGGSVVDIETDMDENEIIEQVDQLPPTQSAASGVLWSSTEAESAYLKLWHELEARLGPEETAALKERYAEWAREGARRARRAQMEKENKRLTQVVANLRADDPEYYRSTILRHEKTIARRQALLASPMYADIGGDRDDNGTTS